MRKEIYAVSNRLREPNVNIENMNIEPVDILNQNLDHNGVVIVPEDININEQILVNNGIDNFVNNVENEDILVENVQVNELDEVRDSNEVDEQWASMGLIEQNNEDNQILRNILLDLNYNVSKLFKNIERLKMLKTSRNLSIDLELEVDNSINTNINSEIIIKYTLVTGTSIFAFFCYYIINKLRYRGNYELVEVGRDSDLNSITFFEFVPSLGLITSYVLKFLVMVFQSIISAVMYKFIDSLLKRNYIKDSIKMEENSEIEINRIENIQSPALDLYNSSILKIESNIETNLIEIINILQSNSELFSRLESDDLNVIIELLMQATTEND